MIYLIGSWYLHRDGLLFGWGSGGGGGVEEDDGCDER